MKEYLDIVARVLAKGKWKKPVRRNPDGSETQLDNDTLALPNQLFSHNMKDGFPLLTTKAMPIKTILVELEGFIKGITSKKWYQERGCKIWNEWANPKIVKEELDDINKDINFSAEEYRKRIQEETDDLGPIYGYQWRHFGEEYEYDAVMEPADKDNHKYSLFCRMRDNLDNITGVVKGKDQLKEIVDRLHNNPYDRRMVCSAWNPNQIHQMALPPCHWGWNITVIDDEINLFWVQRSCDLMLGVPFNIASYAALLLLLAKESGFKPGNLSGMLVDCHIYRNQIPGAMTQLERDPLPLPTLEIRHYYEKPFSIFDWEHKDAGLVGYNNLGKIDFGAVTV